MRLMRSSRVWQLGLLLATLCLAITASARTGREFSGYFDVSGVQEQGEFVQVTLHLKLFNHGDADARSVIVMLMDSSPTVTLRGNFQPVKVWKSRQPLDLKQEFSIPKSDFQEWMQPAAQPNLVILYRDEHGKTLQVGAQVSHGPMVRVSE
jgi:hypothetical protein